MKIEALSVVPDFQSLAATRPAQFPALFMSSGQDGWDILLACPAERQLYFAGDEAAFALALDGLPLGGKASSPLPFVGGWLVYAAYELLEHFEPTVSARADEAPCAMLQRCDGALLRDRRTGEGWLVAQTSTAQAELRAALAALNEWQPAPVTVAAVSEDDPEAFLAGAERCKRYIYEGDVFQVNLSRGWDVTLASGSPHDLFAALRRANPAPFSALVDLGNWHIVSSSPERLVRVRDDVVETRPIAGTHPRGATPEEDAELKMRLLGTVKERAEHIMLVDLERNDLGRIAVPGSVHVDELMAVASYSFVHHIESNIRATLQAGTTPRQLLRALFPGGTITGCPKVRCMQIIRELEDRARGVYTGSVGYIGADGQSDFNILIRSFLQKEAQLYFRAGAGIVADSDPARELTETRHKARGLLRALGVAG
ncbi:aminodeoxychorismate synthase component I [Chitinibacteraceae bacterium HSL-7]